MIQPTQTTDWLVGFWKFMDFTCWEFYTKVRLMVTVTPPKSNRDPENWWLEDYFSFDMVPIREHVNFWVGNAYRNKNRCLPPVSISCPLLTLATGKRTTRLCCGLWTFWWGRTSATNQPSMLNEVIWETRMEVTSAYSREHGPSWIHWFWHRMKYMCWVLNSHYFHIIGDRHQPNSRVLHIPIIRIPVIKGGIFPSPI